jgi:hypothetical protein
MVSLGLSSRVFLSQNPAIYRYQHLSALRAERHGVARRVARLEEFCGNTAELLERPSRSGTVDAALIERNHLIT